MAATQWPFLAAVLLLLSSGLHRSSSLPTCPQSCNCQRATLLNCSSSGLSSVPQLIQDSVTELDLSHNLLDSVTLHRPHRNLRNVRLGNNTIARLSLCMDRTRDGKYLRGRHRLRPWSRGGCVPWAPTLQLLSVERNLLEQLPEGLEGVGSLQVLQLSFNRISTLRPEDLSHLNQLKELDLKHNLITSLHPQMFQDLAQLKVIDLSFNMLTSLNPMMYVTLRNIGVDVRLGGNRWKCDCSMRSLRRRMAYDSSRGLQTWKMVCASPPTLSGRDLLQVEEDELNCFSTEISSELHQDVTVYSGSEILLSCSAEDSVWWTPNGQASVRHPQAGLLISDITERDTGLYVCVSEENQVVSVFNLQISQIGGAKRKPRSVPNISRQVIPQGSLERVGELRNQTTGVTQSDLALAVCLSILFTFLVAFIIGVLARPCIDVLWQNTKRRSTEIHVVSSVEQRQYDNEAFSTGEEQETVEPYRERRVTFSAADRIDENNVQYYDTVASGDQESINDEVFDGEAAEAKRVKRTAGDSESDSSSLQSNQEDKQNDGRNLSSKAHAGQTYNKEFEQIPDSSELEKRRRLSSSSDSSQSENEVAHTTPKSPQVALDSLQQKSDLPTTGKVEVPQISIEAKSEIHGFSSEPFSDWSPHTNSADHAVLQENEELFEFSDSTRSSSALDSVNDPKLSVAPTPDKKKHDDTSSSSSHVSEDEHYTMKSDNNKGDYRHQTKRPGHSSSSDSSDNELVQRTITQAGKENDKLSSRTIQEEKNTSEKIKAMPRTKLRGVGLAVASVSKRRAPSPPARHSSTSSSDSESEITDLKGKQNKGTISQSKSTLNDSAPLPSSGSSVAPTSNKKKRDDTSSSSSHVSEDEHYTVKSDNNKGDYRPHTKRPAPRPGHSSSSDSSDNEPVQRTIKQAGKENDKLSSGTVTGEKDISEKIKPMPRTKWRGIGLAVASVSKGRAPSPPAKHSSTSSSDSELEITDLNGKQNKGTVSQNKSTLNNSAPLPSSGSSSSSDSGEETTKHLRKQEEEDVYMSRPPIKVSRTMSHEQVTQRPTVDLEHTTSIKRNPDITAPSIPSDSSSSSDSEDEITGQTKKQGNVHVTQLPSKGSQTISQEPETKRPALDLEHTTPLKRQVDIQAPSATSDSSSTSDSEDQTKGQIEKQRPGKFDTAQLPFQGSQAKSPDARWPTLDLEHIPRIKRRLDIKVPSQTSDSSSSSESEEETKKSIKKPGQGNVHMSMPPIKVSQTVGHDAGTQRPLLDLEHTTSIKKRPLIKAPSASSDSSSSSDSENETTGPTEKQRPGKLNTAQLPFQGSQAKSPDARWPTLDLEHIPRIKKRLDIKVPSQTSDSSSSSDSEEETKKSIKKPGQGNVHMSMPPIKVSQTAGHDPGTQRPLLDLEHTTSIKQRPLIKAPSASSDSSSSSDSENETTGPTEKQRPGKLNTAQLPFQGSQAKSPDARWPTLDLEHIPRIKKRLDIKVPSQTSDSSSSSDSEEETKKSIKKPGQGNVHMSMPPIKVSQTAGHDPGTQRPLLDLEHTTSIKQQPLIKAPSASSDSSSSSDSENETTGHTEKQRPGKLNTEGLMSQKPQTKSPDPNAKWPTLDLRHVPRLKRRLDIKAPSAASDSSSSSDSEEETTKSIKKPEQGNIYMSRPSMKVSQTVSGDPGTQRPLLDLEHTASIKKRPLIKAPSASSDSSSSSDSENETTGPTEKQRPGKLNTTGLMSQKPQTKSPDPNAKWPTLDLLHVPRLKRRLDIKAPSAASDSSSSSDSEEETKKSVKKPGQGNVHMSMPPIKVSQTVGHDQGTQRPLLDLEHTTSIKKRPLIKAPSASSDSSSSSDSENETTGHTDKQRPGKLNTAGLMSQKPQTKSPDPNAKWPSLDLLHVPRLKRRLDIKAPSAASDSSSSSDSEEETTKSIKKPEQGNIYMSRPSMKVSQTVSGDPGTQRPLLDLEHTASIKKSPLIKAPSVSSDSSSSSDSENETTGHTEKQRPGKLNTAGLMSQKPQTKSPDPNAKWPTLDLLHVPRLKRRLDIKAPSAASDSSSSSDSEDETTKSIKKPGLGNVHMSMPPIKVSQTVDHDPGTQRPLLDLEHTTSIKKRPLIKAPSASSDSSSSSDSENETTGHTDKQRPGKLNTAGLMSQKPQTKSPDPNAKWPTLDLLHVPRLKRRLDVKAPSAASDSSSSSDSEEETTKSIKKPEQGNIHISRPSMKVSQTVGHDQGTQRPLLDLEYTTSIKKRPLIKAPSASSDSSSSSDSENETTGHTDKQRPGKLNTAGLMSQKPQTKSPDPNAKWPTLDLLHVPRLKRRLDIKAPSAASDSSSSSDSEEETTKSIKKPEQGNIHMSRPSIKVSQTVGHDPGSQRPLLDLEHTTSIKRRSDIKAPSASSDSSSSSDSDDETGHTKKQRPVKLITTGLPLQGSQTKRHDPDSKWPTLDLRHIPRLKRRLDIKAPSPAFISSSSSDSEEETTKSIKNQEQGNIHMSRPSIKVSPTVGRDPGTQRPLLDLEHTTSIKRHPDIKAPSPASDSSSSSESEDETTRHIKKPEQDDLLLSRPPNTASPTVSHEPETRWPLIDLGSTTSIKRRLDIKPPSAASASSSSSESEDETTKHMKKQEKQPPVKISQALSLKPQTQRPAIDLEHTTSIKKRLDIKAPSASSSSDSDDETGHTEKQRPGKLITTGLPLQGSQTKSHDPDAKWPGQDLQYIPHFKRRLDIKAPSPVSNSSSSSDSEEETTKSIKNQEQGSIHMSRPSIKVSPTVGHDPGTQRPLLDLEHTTSIKRHPDIKAPSLASNSSSSSESEDETTRHIKKPEQGDLLLSRPPNKASPKVSHEPETRWPLLDLERTTLIKRRLDIKPPSAASGSSSSSESEDETPGHTEKQRPGKLDISGLPFRQSPSVDLGNITHKNRLDIKPLPTQPNLGLKSVSSGSRKSESNSSTSDSEDEKRSHKAKVGAGVSVTPKVPEKDLMIFSKAPLRNIFHSPKTEQNIKLIKYTVVSDDVGNKPTNGNIHKTPDISPELQSRWATMNLGISRSRRRLDSSPQKQKSSDLPSSPPPDSPSYSSESGPGSPISRTRLKRKDVGITLTGSSLIHSNKPVIASPTMKDQPDTMFSFGVPYNRKHLDIRGSEKAPATASQQQPDSSSSSDSEDERVEHKAPDMNLGIPRIQRRLNTKAPSQKPSSSSSSSSESEKDMQKYTDKQSRYPPLSPSDKSLSVNHTNAPTSRRTAPSMSFDDMVKSRIQQSQRKTDFNLPPELTWTGIGHRPSDLSISTPNLNTVSIQPASLVEPKLPPAYSSSTKRDIKITQDSGKSDATIVHKHSSLRADPVSPTSRGALHRLMNLPSNKYETSRAVTENPRERKGLKALKNMALERQQFEAEDLNKGPFSLLDGSIPPSDTSVDYHRSEADMKVLSKQPLTHLASASIIERRPTDLSYEVSHYRSHNVREPSYATPPPSYEAAGLTWRSPQNPQKQVWEGNISHQQQRKSSEGSDTTSENSNSLNFDYSNTISHV